MHWTRKSQTLSKIFFDYSFYYSISLILLDHKGTGMPFNSHMSRDKVIRNQSLKYLSLIRAGKYLSRSQHPGIEEQKDVAMHLKQGRWMVLFYSEGELVVEDKLNFLQFRMHLWRHWSKSTELGCYRVVIVSADKRLVDICNKHRKIAWQDQALLMDLHNFHPQGVITQFLFVTKVVIAQVLDTAVRTTRFPVHCLQQIMSNIG